MGKPFFKDMGNGYHLFFLFFFFFSGYIIAMFMSLAVALLMGVDPFSPLGTQPLMYIRLSQAVSVVCWLLLPAIAYIRLFHGNAESFFRLNKSTTWQYVVLAILLILAVQPIVGLLGYFNDQITFPESLSSFEAVLRKLENMAAQTVERLVADKSIGGVISNVFVIAIIAAFVEEIFFRGCLQQILCKIVKNKHMAIWITAVIFSAVHMEFFGFIPRVFLGALLGYLFLWSGNLWIPIIAHFINNFGAILLQQWYYGTPEYQKIMEGNPFDDVWTIVFSVIFTPIIVYLLIKRRPKVLDSTL